MYKQFFEFTTRMAFNKTMGQFIIPIPINMRIFLINSYVKDNEVIVNFDRIDSEKKSDSADRPKIQSLPTHDEI